MSKHSCQVTVPRWALFPKTSLLQILLFINIKIIKKQQQPTTTKNWRNPLSNILASCWMSVSLLQNTMVFAHRWFLAHLPSRVLLFTQSAVLGTAQEEYVTDTNSSIWTTSFTEPFLLVTGFTTGFLPPLQNQLDNSVLTPHLKVHLAKVIPLLLLQNINCSGSLRPTRAAIYIPLLLFPADS